jgi:hypothetical protein
VTEKSGWLGRCLLGCAYAVLALLLALLFLRIEIVRDWLSRKMPESASDPPAPRLTVFDVSSLTLILELFLGLYAAVFAVLAVHTFESGRGQRPSLKVRLVNLALVAAGLSVALAIHFTPWGTSLAVPVKISGLLLVVFLIDLAAARYLSLLQGAALGLLLVVFAAFKVPQWDRRLEAFEREVLEKKDS